MTNQIADTILEKMAPLGVAVVVEATHLCMSMRGVEKQNSYAVTSAMLGAFRNNARTRMEFLELIKLRSVRRRSRDRLEHGMRRRLNCRIARIAEMQEARRNSRSPQWECRTNRCQPSASAAAFLLLNPAIKHASLY